MLVAALRRLLALSFPAPIREGIHEVEGGHVDGADSSASPIASPGDEPSSSVARANRLTAAIRPRIIAPRQVGGWLRRCWRRCSALPRASARERGRERERRTVPAWVPRCLRLRRC